MSLAGTARIRLAYLKKRVTQPTARRLDQRPDLRGYSIGKYSWGHLTLTNRTPGCTLTVGNFCSFAFGTRIVLGGEHRADFVSTYRFPAYEPFSSTLPPGSATPTVTGADVSIGHDVWTGHDALILSGVTIGDGVVVGAGSVVRQNIPPYAIVAGNPARVAGYRFPTEQIDALMRIRWWDWDDDRVVAALPDIMSDDIQKFIDTYDVAE